MSKVEANKILKEHGLAAVKKIVPGGGYGSMAKTRVIKDSDNKQIKGICIAQHSPMDCTSVKRERADSSFNALVHDLAGKFSKVPSQYEGSIVQFIVKETKKKRTVLYLDRTCYNAYSMQMNMDPGYQNEYIVPRYEEVELNG